MTKRGWIALLLVLGASLALGNRVVNRDLGGGSPSIDSVTFYAVVRSEATAADDIRFSINTVIPAGSQVNNIGTTYAERSYVATTNPADAGAWEESDIAGIVAGLNTRDISGEVRVTQLWFVVNRTGAADTLHRPNADAAYDGSWTGNVGGANLYVDIDDTSSDDDTTYVSTTTDFDAFQVAFEDSGTEI